MHIACPYCSHHIKTPKAPPGAYVPSCPKCEVRFRLILSDKAPVVLRLEEGEEVEIVPALRGPPPTAETMAVATTANLAVTMAHGGVATIETAPSRETGAGGATGGFCADATAAFDPNTIAQLGGENAPGRGFSIPDVVGGYRIAVELGRGAMGAVFKARQLSLDRNVALKIIQPALAADPVFISRFTREAYAAAQLSHPNIVQVFDMGVDKGLHYFSMELVPGRTLAQLIREKGKLDVEAAVGYALQAARGLKHAHDCGLIHRDVKPDNLLVAESGVVKVADLGLVKSTAVKDAIEQEESLGAAAAVAAASSAGVTLANVAMGTPAYMPPEQAENAAAVDNRADIYSLGCTLYVMLTGRPLFEGATAIEVMSKHRAAPITPPETIVKRIPAGVSEITVKMLEKKPADRYQDMGEVIDALERFLGIRSSGAYSPGESEAKTLEGAIYRFNAAPAKKLREGALFGLFCVWVAMFVLAALFGGFRPGSFALLVGLFTPLFYFAVSGLRGRTPLLMRLREFVFTSRAGDLAVWGVGLVFALLLALASGLFVPAIIAGLLAAVVAAAIHFGLDGMLSKQRRGPIEDVERLLKSMRLKGIAEEAVRLFVAKYSGPDWEELFEALFGYDAKVDARRHLPPGHGERRRRKFRPWREPIVNWMEAKTKARRQAKERKLLQKTEEAGLQAEGVDFLQARRKAQAAAAALVEQADRVRHYDIAVSASEASAAAQKRAMIKSMLLAARTGKGEPQPKPGRSVFQIADTLLGATSRFLVGAALLLGCGLWAHQNGLLSRERLDEAGKKLQQAAEESIEQKQIQVQAIEGAAPAAIQERKPLSLPLVPSSIESLFRNFQPGVAGVLLLLSALVRGRRIYFFAWPAALVAWVGDRLGIPGVGEIVPPGAVSAVAGTLLGIAGMLFGRSKRA